MHWSVDEESVKKVSTMKSRKHHYTNRMNRKSHSHNSYYNSPDVLQHLFHNFKTLYRKKQTIFPTIILSNKGDETFLTSYIFFVI